MRDLLASYRQTLRTVRRAWKRATEQDRPILAGMVRDVELAIAWLERHVGEVTAATPRSRPRRREVLVDPAVLDRLRAAAQRMEDAGLPENSAREAALEGALSLLSPAEREVYTLVVGGRYTFREAAELLGVTKSTVQTLMERARRKLAGERTCVVRVCA